jgi:hypothetical protein
MSERKTFKFEHLGCTLIVLATNVDGEWRSHFDLAFPSDANNATLSGDGGPYSSAEEAFETTKDWARRVIEQRMEKPSTQD